MYSKISIKEKESYVFGAVNLLEFLSDSHIHIWSSLWSEYCIRGGSALSSNRPLSRYSCSAKVWVTDQSTVKDHHFENRNFYKVMWTDKAWPFSSSAIQNLVKIAIFKFVFGAKLYRSYNIRDKGVSLRQKVIWDVEAEVQKAVVVERFELNALLFLFPETCFCAIILRMTRIFPWYLWDCSIVSDWHTIKSFLFAITRAFSLAFAPTIAPAREFSYIP